MNKYFINVEVPVITTEVHEVEVEAMSPELAALEVQTLEIDFSSDTLYKTLDDKRFDKPPYKINAARRIIDTEETEE